MGSFPNKKGRLGTPYQDAQNMVNTSTIARLKAEADARPKMPGYESIRDEAGALKAQYQIKDPGAVKSPWLAQQLEQQAGMQTAALNRGNQQAATAAAGAQAGLARRGGLTSGAAERLGAGSEEQRQLAAQNIYQAGDQQRLGMQTEDMQQERGFQTNLQQQNLQNTLGEIASKRQFDLGKYEEEMKGYAANKAAEATKKGGGGTVICTALMDVGLVSPADREAASLFRAKVSRDTYEAYLRWGVPVAKVIRKVPVVGYLFRPLVRYWIGDRDLLARFQYTVFNKFNKLFVKKFSVKRVQEVI